MSTAHVEPEELERLGRLAAPEAVERLHVLAEQLPVTNDPERLAKFAGAIPVRVAELSPEVSRALQEIAMLLVPHRPRLPGDIQSLEPACRALWHRVALCIGKAELEDLDLGRAVHGWSFEPVLELCPLVLRLRAASESWLRERALQAVQEGVASLALTVEEAFSVVLELTSDPHVPLRTRALRALRAGWLAKLPARARQARDDRLHAVLDDSEVDAAVAAIETLGALGHRDRLLEVLARRGAPSRLVAASIVALGPRAEEDDLKAVLQRASADILDLGPALRMFVLAAHRHGTFIREPDLPTVLELFDAHHGWSGEEIVRVTHIVRNEFVERLASLCADDPRWVRRAELLGLSMSGRAPRVIEKVLWTTKTPAIAAALVNAAGQSLAYDAEEPLLAWLSELPEDVIPVLRFKGGTRAESRLRTIVEDRTAVPSLRELAQPVLWSLCRDRDALLAELSTSLGPHDSGLLEPGRSRDRDPVVARIVAAGAWPTDAFHAIAPRQEYGVLCESGDIEHLPRIGALFRELVQSCVRRALAGDFSVKRLELPELEQQLFRYGRHLVKAGRRVRRTAGGFETGTDLVLGVICDWLEERPSKQLTVALLEMAARQGPTGPNLRRVELYWRDGDGDVQRAALEVIVAAGERARGLELSVCRLAQQDDPRIVVGALEAIQTLRADWAEPIALAALRHPRMAVKKAAAEALAVVATAGAVADLVEWLAHHDNPGFRAPLLAALQRAAGPSWVGVLVDTLCGESERRRIELLRQALSGGLTARAATRLARSPRASDLELLNAALDGKVRLIDASPDELAGVLHRRRASPQAATVGDPCAALRRSGFSVERAVGLVQAQTPEHDGAVQATVRLAFREWLSWLDADEARGTAAAVQLVLESARNGDNDHWETLLGVAERECSKVEPWAVAGFMRRCLVGNASTHVRLRAMALLRRLPHSAKLGGLERFRLLGQLGAVMSNADLFAALDENKIAPNSHRLSATLLEEALQIPRKADGEPEADAALREVARDWHAGRPQDRRAWLEEALMSRPLGLPLVPVAPAARARVELSEVRERVWLKQLAHVDRGLRERAAQALLDWPDAVASWSVVLDAFVDGRVAMPPRYHARLASQLLDWPDSTVDRVRVQPLVEHLSCSQRRTLVGRWIRAWERGQGLETSLLDTACTELLLAWMWACARAGDYRPTRLLTDTDSLSARSLFEFVAQRSPQDVAHLRRQEPKSVADSDEEPTDPIATKSSDELVALIGSKGVAQGLAVRAVHAIAARKVGAEVRLRPLVTDKRPAIRSAALRALHRVATRDATLSAKAEALAMETRRDVILQLMRGLAHGQHLPALPRLIERLEHRDLRVREGARDAIEAWGPSVAPDLRRALKRMRPDRRGVLLRLIERLEA